MHLDQQVHFVDWLPTLLAAAGIERSEGRALYGRNALPVLRGDTADEPPPRFWQLNQYELVGWINAAMRDGPRKLVRPQQRLLPASEEDQRIMDRYIEVDIQYKYHPEEVTSLMDDPDPELIVPPPASTELYNLADDPLEKVNLAESEAPRTARMISALENWFEEVEGERRRIVADGSIG
mgnify:FL=1